ncbi:MAG TPA: RHS repeat domain-containing protein, partial [Bryobacteraceae bacterium]|nr:RHS repeat domain-containing protein [Bryobacteraceae bacterium]
MTSATNPESGPIIYDYDSNGNLVSRSDSRGASMTLDYDTWNRVTGKTYTPGSAEVTPNVTYTYDAHVVASGTSYPKGRLTEVAVAGGTAVRYDQYDGLGRVLKSSQITDGQGYGFVYTYNPAGSLESIQYPVSSRKVFTCYDTAGRVQSLKKDSMVGTDVYAEVVDGTDPDSAGVIAGYSPLGGMQRLALDSGRLLQRWDYNDRGQLTRLQMYRTPGTTVSSLMKLQPDYGVASTNNGNVMSQSIAVSGTAFTASQSYTYDAWNRLETVAEGTNWKQKFGYDRWGNRWTDQTLTSGIAVAPGTPIGSEWYNSGNNQMLVSHDLAGNASPMPGRIYKYDVENRIVSVDGGTAALNESFAYDG